MARLPPPRRPPGPTVTGGLPGYDAKTSARESLARAVWISRRLVAGTPVSDAAHAAHQQRMAETLTVITKATAKNAPREKEEGDR